jgi:hypothetical protein
MLQNLKLVSIVPSYSTKHKFIATFQEGSTQHHIKFGARGYGDYIQYSKQDCQLAEQKKKAYIARHSVNETWSDPMKPGTLSRFILWNKPTLRASISDFKKRFHL